MHQATFENLTKEEDYQRTVDFFKVMVNLNIKERANGMR